MPLKIKNTLFCNTQNTLLDFMKTIVQFGPCNDDHYLLYLDFRKQVLGNQYSTPGLFPGTIPTIQPLLAKKASYGEAGQVISKPSIHM